MNNLKDTKAYSILKDAFMDGASMDDVMKELQSVATDAKKIADDNLARINAQKAKEKLRDDYIDQVVGIIGEYCDHIDIKFDATALYNDVSGIFKELEWPQPCTPKSLDTDSLVDLFKGWIIDEDKTEGGPDWHSHIFKAHKK